MVTPRLMHVRNALILLIRALFGTAGPGPCRRGREAGRGACASAVPSAVRSVRTRVPCPGPGPGPSAPELRSELYTPGRSHSTRLTSERERESVGCWLVLSAVAAPAARRCGSEYMSIASDNISKNINYV